MGNILWQILDHCECRHSLHVRNRLVELFLQLRHDLRMPQAVEQQRAAGVARGVTARDQLRQRLGGQFLTAQFLALLVAALHEAGKQVDAVGFRVRETCVHARDGDAGEFLDRFHAVGEEGVGQVLGVGFELGEAADCARGRQVSKHTLGENPGTCNLVECVSSGKGMVWTFTHPDTSPLRLSTSIAGANVGGASGVNCTSATSFPRASMPNGAPNARSPMISKAR